MNSDLKGLAVIINNDKFTGEDYARRKVSQVDVKNLGSLLNQMGFTVVISQNITRTETEKFIIDVTRHMLKLI